MIVTKKSVDNSCDLLFLLFPLLKQFLSGDHNLKTFEQQQAAVQSQSQQKPTDSLQHQEAASKFLNHNKLNCNCRENPCLYFKQKKNNDQ